MTFCLNYCTINSLSLYAHNQVPTVRGIGELSSTAVQTFNMHALYIVKFIHELHQHMGWQMDNEFALRQGIIPQ